MRSLFEISEDLFFLEDFLTDTGGELTDEAMEAEIDKWLADLGEERDTKIDNYCALFKEMEARALARKEEAMRMSRLADVDANAAGRLKSRLFNFFDTHNIDRVDTARFRVTRVNNGGALPLFIDKDMEDDPEKLPEPFRKIVYAPDRPKICEALAPVEAARLRAESSQQALNALMQNMLRVETALANQPEEDDPEAVMALEAELKGYKDVYDETVDLAGKDRDAYDELRAAIPFARLGQRGKHLRIK